MNISKILSEFDEKYPRGVMTFDKGKEFLSHHCEDELKLFLTEKITGLLEGLRMKVEEKCYCEDNCTCYEENEIKKDLNKKIDDILKVK